MKCPSEGTGRRFQRLPQGEFRARAARKSDDTTEKVQRRHRAQFLVPQFRSKIDLHPLSQLETTGSDEMQSALRIAASEEDAPATCVGVVLLQLIKCFAMGRTKANVNPPAAIPQITGADT
jgi:hypothetical protein